MHGGFSTNLRPWIHSARSLLPSARQCSIYASPAEPLGLDLLMSYLLMADVVPQHAQRSRNASSLPRPELDYQRTVVVNGWSLRAIWTALSEHKELTCGYKTFIAHVRRLQQAATTETKAITPEKRKEFTWDPTPNREELIG